MSEFHPLPPSLSFSLSLSEAAPLESRRPGKDVAEGNGAPQMPAMASSLRYTDAVRKWSNEGGRYTPREAALNYDVGATISLCDVGVMISFHDVWL